MLRPVLEDDLPTLFAQQLDPDALRMASFAPREWDAFVTHWRGRVLADPDSVARTILEGGDVAGYIVSFAAGTERCVGYWVGKAHWGKGIATAALAEFLDKHEQRRPLRAYVAVTNAGSIRVLEKCGFVRVAPPTKGQDGVEELLFLLEARGRSESPDPVGAGRDERGEV